MSEIQFTEKEQVFVDEARKHIVDGSYDKLTQSMVSLLNEHKETLNDEDIEKQRGVQERLDKEKRRYNEEIDNVVDEIVAGTLPEDTDVKLEARKRAAAPGEYVFKDRGRVVRNPAAFPFPEGMPVTDKSQFPINRFIWEKSATEVKTSFVEYLMNRDESSTNVRTADIRSFRFLITLILAWIVVGARKLLRPFKTVKRQLEEVLPALRIYPIPGIKKFLNRKAKKLLRAKLRAVMLERGGEVISMARYANIRVPLNADGNIPTMYIRRWAAFLNDLAEKGVWKYATLCGPALVPLTVTTDSLHHDALLVTFIFTDGAVNETPEELNARVGGRVFTGEGETNSASWDEFPWGPRNAT